MNKRQKAITSIICLAIIAFMYNFDIIPTTTIVNNNLKLKSEYSEDNNKADSIVSVETIQSTNQKKKMNVVYDGLTLEELSDKLERSLNSTIKGKGELFASYSVELGLDPYLALAIVLEETGCKWECSALVRECNNVGGMKGSPGCWGGSYKSFSTIDEGIKAHLDNLYYNYYSKGLTTPELINPKYAESTTWASHINNYINQIKNA